MVAEREDWTTDGRLHLLVDPAKLRSALGGDSVNWPLIKSWLADLAQALVEFHIKTPDVSGMGGLMSEVVEAKVQPPGSRPGAFTAGRRYLRISFGTGWSRLVADDNEMRYPVKQVAGLRHGFSQAVARYCLSHRCVNDTVDGLMVKLSADGRARVRKHELETDAAALAALGIKVSGDSVESGTSVTPPKTSETHLPASKVPVPASKVPVPASKVPVKTPFYQYSQEYQAGTPALMSGFPETQEKHHTPRPFGAERQMAYGLKTIQNQIDGGVK